MAPVEPNPAWPAPWIDVEVWYSPAPRQVEIQSLRLPAGATLTQAWQQAGYAERHPALDLSQARVGIWGRLVAPDQVLRDRDRVEVYRPLAIDPKDARRRRHAATRGGRAVKSR